MRVIFVQTQCNRLQIVNDERQYIYEQVQGVTSQVSLLIGTSNVEINRLLERQQFVIVQEFKLKLLTGMYRVI